MLTKNVLSDYFHPTNAPLGITRTQQNLANKMRFFSMLATTCDLWEKKKKEKEKEKAKATYFFLRHGSHTAGENP